MNSFDRFKQAVDHREPDCVPVAPYMGNYGASLAGIPIDQYCRSGELMARGQLQACDMLDQDVVVAQSDNYYISEAFGMTVSHHPNSSPTFATPAFTDLATVRDIEVPDPYSMGRMPVILQAVELLAAQVKGEKIIRVPGSGPFTLASHIIGTEKFLMDLAMLDADGDPEAEADMRVLLDLCTETVMAFQKACIDTGADLIQVGDSLASLDMISPAMYRKWAWPYEKQCFDFVNDYGRSRGCRSILHICGNNTTTLYDMASTGADIIEIDSKVDLAHAKRVVGERCALMGNLDPSAVLMQGTPEDVDRAARQAIRDAGVGGGFILGSGCEVSPLTPLENMKHLVRVARSTTYPLD